MALPKPAWTAVNASLPSLGGRCDWVIRAVDYRVLFSPSGANGGAVTAVLANVTFTSLSASPAAPAASLTQAFSVDFQPGAAPGSPAIRPKSGENGYRLGAPLLAGVADGLFTPPRAVQRFQDGLPLLGAGLQARRPVTPSDSM